MKIPRSSVEIPRSFIKIPFSLIEILLRSNGFSLCSGDLQMKSLIFPILLMALTTITSFAQIPPIEAGVSQTLAKWRAANYSDVRYKLNITLEKGAALMKGDIEIRVNLTDEGAKNDLILDWRTTQFAGDKDKPFAKVVAVNRKMDIPPIFDKEHILISRGLLQKGENYIKIEFASPIKTSGAAITRYVDKEDGAEYVYSLFVPSDASTAFPVFDQPDLKARFQLTLVSPLGWQVVSNSKRESVSLADPVKSLTKLKHIFAETQPISTYVFAFAAGDFEIFIEGYDKPISVVLNEDDEINKEKYAKDSRRPTEFYKRITDPNLPNIYVRKSQAEKFKQHADEVFRLNREGVRFLESWFDYKFPFPKYDLVLIPEFPFGGMEHAGATFLREDRVIFPTEPTKNDYITRANVIFHEAAHQWFGDTVTMRWFDDLWLKEGFAEFMAYKTLEKVMPEYNAWKIFYERNKQAAYLTDATRGTTPIYQEIPNLSAAKSAYGNIVYRKAPSFLRQAEFYLGEDKFQTAVRAFLKKHEFANASWEDLVSDFARAKYNLPASGSTISNADAQGVRELLDWANTWVTKRGLPIVRVSDGCGFDNNFKMILCTETKDKKPVYEISQKDSLAENSLWTQKFKVYQFEKNQNPEYKDSVLIDTFTLGKPTEQIILSQKASFVFPNYQDYGYGIFLLDDKSRAYVLENIQTEKDDFLRTMMWGALWDSVRETELAPADYVKLVIKNISVESDESTIQTILGRVSTAMNYYLSDAQSKELAPKLEAVLIDKMRDAPTLGQRITFYRAFLNVAASDNARAILKDVLSGKFQIKDLQLKTKDRFDVVTRLAILGDADAPKSFADLQKTETSDEAGRYAYAALAGSPNKENAAKYFNDFLNNKEVSESYIESAFVPFNSVRHSELTLPYLEKALAELPNLKRNRKIFFVNGWLAAFIGGQKSEQALAIVNKFLADNPNLDKDLRLKILENADGLERAVKIRAKFGK
jgi:aminopeptidase N